MMAIPFVYIQARGSYRELGRAVVDWAPRMSSASSSISIVVALPA